MFQFTHPGGVRHGDSSCRPACHRVSIHAPGRGATPCGCPTSCRDCVSIHAPGRGATTSDRQQRNPHIGFNSRTREGCDCKARASGTARTCFNSRTREGCDFQDLGLQPVMSHVSIHAPGRGATVAKMTLTEIQREFQFTHPGGVRRSLRMPDIL